MFFSALQGAKGDHSLNESCFMENKNLIRIGLMSAIWFLSFGNARSGEQIPITPPVGEANPCDAGSDKSFENCRDKNCTEVLNIQCSFTYDKDVITNWGRKEK